MGLHYDDSHNECALYVLVGHSHLFTAAAFSLWAAGTLQNTSIVFSSTAV